MERPSTLLVATIALAATSIPVVSRAAEAAPPKAFVSVLRAPQDDARFRTGEVRLAVRDNVDLFMRGGRDKPAGEPFGRRPESAVGPAPKAVKLGVLIRW